MKVFESADFTIFENRGVKTDKAGNMTLGAKAALNEPCSFCGKKHVYRASELPCPFGSPEKERNPKKENAHGKYKKNTAD